MTRPTASPVRAAPTVPGVVRVGVASDTRSVDLVLPSALPVAELVPGLARAVGLLDADRVAGGYRILTPGGRRLEGHASLAGQGVEDGAVLTVVAGLDDELARRYDDPAEATADVLADRVPSWPPGAGRRVALGAAALLLVLALVAQLLVPVAPGGRGDPANAAAAAALALVACALALSRWGAADAAAVLAWAAVGHAALAGAQLAPAATSHPGGPVAAAGAGALAVALAALAGLASDRIVLLPAALLGALALAAGSLAVVEPVGARTLAAGMLVAAVLAGGLTPRLAVGVGGVGGSGPGPPGAEAIDAEGPPPMEIPAEEPPGLDVPEVDLAAVSADALLAHRVLVALEVTLGLLVVPLAPLAVALGPAGVALGLCCGAVVLLRARRFRAAAPVLVCLACGGAASAATLGAVLLQHPGARAPLAGVLAAAALVLSATLTRGGAGWHRLADLAESCCLIALLPLVVTAAGGPGRVAHLLGSVAG